MAIQIWFRNVDRRVPFLWESTDQPSARWHAAGRGPVQYASDTPEGAWAELIRHEGITDPDDLAGISRSLWALEVEVSDEKLGEPSLASANLLGDLDSYPTCQAEAERLRTEGASGLISASAALLHGAACGEVVESGELRPGPVKDGRTLCLFGPRPQVVGHQCVEDGRPPERVLGLTRQLELR
jgi:RES domain